MPVPTHRESELDPVALRSGFTVAPISTQAERKRSRPHGAGRRTRSGTEEGALLAGVWTTVAVAGQTREHLPTIDGQACRERAINRAATRAVVNLGDVSRREGNPHVADSELCRSLELFYDLGCIGLLCQHRGTGPRRVRAG
jgi:hypothetical protein